jgi:proteasome assembly chaperone (PAC2) family protein
MEGRDFIRLYNVPELRRPYMIAAWSGMGAVALLAANYLRQELDATFFGEIDPLGFFSPSQVLIQDGLVQEPEFPEHKFYFWRGGEAHDLVILVGTEQPDDIYGMAVQVLDAAHRLGVERIYTAAALATFMHHAQDPMVWGTATHRPLLVEMQHYGIQILEQGTISGLNGLLLSIARERGMEGICLLGEIPIYASQIVNPKTTRAVLQALSAMLGIRVNLDKLVAWVETLDPQMDQLYQILPDHAKQAIERHAEMGATRPSISTSADQPLVANDQFFDEIERFLQEHKGPEEESGEDEEE